MNALWLLILSLSFSPAQAGWQDHILSESTLEKARLWVLDHTDQSVNLFLFEHLPKLFPIPFVCKLQKDKQTRVILPRDPEFTVEKDAELLCPELARFTAKDKSIMYVYMDRSLPAVEVKSGDAEIVPLGNRFVLRSAGSGLEITKTEGNPVIRLRADASGSVAYVNQGLLEGNYAATGNTLRFYLGSRKARIGLRSASFSGERYIFPNEIYSPLDLALPRGLLTIFDPRETWKKADVGLSSETGLDFSISWLPHNANEAQIGLLNRPVGTKQCRLYTRLQETGEFVKAYDFQPDNQSTPFTVKLHPDYAKYFLNVGCNDEAKNIIFSNQLPPFNQPQIMVVPAPRPGPK